MNITTTESIDYSYTNDTDIKHANQQQKKQEILHAFQQSNLSFRNIERKNESIYLNNEKKDPRPVYLVVSGVPTVMRAATIANPTLGIINPVCLSAYKANACTNALMDAKENIDQLPIKCLANCDALVKKMQEQSAIIWEVYQSATSGHLMANGSFKPPKFKQKPTIASTHTIPHSELLTIGYNKQQIKCFCIPEADINNIATIIEVKKKLESELELEELPLAIYSEKNGSLQVFFTDELPINSLEKLKQNRFNLDQLGYLLDFNPENLHNTINMLPTAIKINLLQNTEFNFDKKYLELTNQAIKIVSHKENYNVKDLQRLIEEGVNVKYKVFYQGKYLSYANILLASEQKRSFEIYNNKQKQSIEHEAKAIELFQELLLNESSLDLEDNFIFFISYRETIIKLCIITGISLNNIGYKYILFDNINMHN